MQSTINEIERGQLCQSTVEALYRASGGLSNFPGLLRKIIQERAWERRVTKGKVVELSSLRELITAKPIQGWGEDPRKIEAIIKDDPEVYSLWCQELHGTLGEHRRPTKEEKQDDKGGATTFINEDRNTNSYWHARIRRDCPEEIANIQAGTKTIRDVRRERGWLPKSKRVTLTGDPDVDVARLVDAWGEDYLERIKQA